MAREILFLTLYDESGASSRLCVYQFLPAFQRAGFKTTVRPLLTGDVYKLLSALAETKSVWKLLGVFFRLALQLPKRIAHIREAARADVVVVQKDVLPFGLSWYLSLFKKPIICNVDDPIWLPNPGAGGGVPILGPAFSWLRRDQLVRLLKRSKITMVESLRMREFPGRYCPRVEVLNSAIDMRAYAIERKPTLELSFGWIGSPSTVHLLREILPWLETLAETHSFALYNISSSPVTSSKFAVHNWTWTAEKERLALEVMTIGLQPVDNTPFNFYRTSRKWLIHSTCGIPTLASAFGMNEVMLRDGETALLYRSRDEFLNQAKRLLDDGALRERIATNAHREACREFDLPVLEQRFLSLVGDLTGSPRLP